MDVDGWKEYVRKRITNLRLAKGVSEYKMSTDLGHSRSYVQSIVTGRALPSFSEFLYVCEYLGVEPGDFFDAGVEHPGLMREAVEGLGRLDEDDLRMVLAQIKRLGRG